jgi:predicted DNA-binding transcriptional regulator AlpA
MENAVQAVTQSQPPALKPQGLATLMGVSTRTLRRWEIRGLVPRPFLVGTQKYWLTDEILDWISCHCPARGLWERMRPKYRRKAN